ncbi:unnamed protein product, partial [Didymodactylos carnosus]
VYDKGDDVINDTINEVEDGNNNQYHNGITNHIDNDLSMPGTTVRFSNYDDNTSISKSYYDDSSTVVSVNTDTTQFDELFKRSKTTKDNGIVLNSPPHPRCYSSTSPPRTSFQAEQFYYQSQPHLSQQHSHITVPVTHMNHRYYYENDDVDEEKIEKREEQDGEEEKKLKKNKLLYSTGIYSTPNVANSNSNTNSTSFFSPFTDSTQLQQQQQQLQNSNNRRQSIGLKVLSHHIPTDTATYSSSPPSQQVFPSAAVASAESARTRRKKYSLTHTTFLQSNNQNDTPLVRSCSYKRPQSIKKYRQKRSSQQPFQTSSPKQQQQQQHLQLEKKNSVGSTTNKSRKYSAVTTHNNYSLQQTRKSISVGTTRISAVDLMATDDPADQWSSPKSPRSSRVGSLPLDHLQLPDEEIYRIRQFNTTSKGFVNRG